MADQLLTGTTLIEDKRGEFGKVWSCSGTNFHGLNPDIDDLIYGASDGAMSRTAGTITPIAPVQLPHGSKITKVIVYTNDGTDVWTLKRSLLSDASSTSTLATANANTEDTTITDELVDNNNYCYFLGLQEGLDGFVYGARIIYE